LEGVLKEEKVREVLHAYYAIFSSQQGQVVLADMKKRYARPLSSGEFDSHGNLARRVAKREVIDDIETAVTAGSRLVHNSNVRESLQPDVIFEEEEER
jgi:hypothetical protein